MDEGYQQALANYAFEVDRLTADAAEVAGTDDPIAVAVILMSGTDPLLRERAQELDHIITVICSTYHRTEAQVDADIDAAIKQRVQKYS